VAAELRSSPLKFISSPSSQKHKKGRRSGLAAGQQPTPNSLSMKDVRSALLQIHIADYRQVKSTSRGRSSEIISMIPGVCGKNTVYYAQNVQFVQFVQFAR
jgi:hypothetical protein